VRHNCRYRWSTRRLVTKTRGQSQQNRLQRQRICWVSTKDQSET